MHQNPIGFFDSGVGGLSVLKHAIKVMPEENYIYFGDSLNAPYGTKTNEQVFNLTRAGINKLIVQNVKAIVVACNTATSIAVDELRKTTKIPIISMEPAIKPALEKTDGNVLLLATNVTLSSKRVNNLIEKYDLNNRVIKLPCPELAKKIEEAVFEQCLARGKGRLGVGVIIAAILRETGSVLALQQKPADLRYRRLLKLQGSEVVELENNP